MAEPEGEVVTVAMVSAQVQLLNNPARPVALSVPADMTDEEALSLIVTITQIRDQLVAARTQSRIAVATPGEIAAIKAART